VNATGASLAPYRSPSRLALGSPAPSGRCPRRVVALDAHNAIEAPREMDDRRSADSVLDVKAQAEPVGKAAVGVYHRDVGLCDIDPVPGLRCHGVATDRCDPRLSGQQRVEACSQAGMIVGDQDADPVAPRVSRRSRW
jgi:hypothetical protein